MSISNLTTYSERDMEGIFFKRPKRGVRFLQHLMSSYKERLKVAKKLIVRKNRQKIKFSYYNYPMDNEHLRANVSITEEIIKMAADDQEMMRKYTKKDAPWDKTVLQRNTARLKDIISQIGWPTKSRVGDEASGWAWLIVQHSDFDMEFQKSCLKQMREASEGEVKKQNIAYLEDRVLRNENRPQKYGTQLKKDESGNWMVQETEDLENINQRRAQMGLGTLEEYIEIHSNS